MPINLDRDVLASATAFVARLVPTRPASPTHAAMTLTPTASGITITGTDGESWAQSDVPTDGRLPGPVAIPAHLFATWVGAMKGPTITLAPSEDSTGMRATCGRATLDMSTVQGGLPDAPDPIPATATVGRPGLVDMLKRLTPFVSTELAELSTIELTLAGDTLRGCATDRYSMARVTIPATGTLPEPAYPHMRQVSDLVGLMDGPTVSIAADDYLVHIHGRTTRATIRQIPWEGWGKAHAMINKDLPERSTVATAALRAAIEQAVKLAPLAGGDTRKSGVMIDCDGDHATVTLRNTAIANLASDPTPWRGVAQRIAINPAYLLAALGAVRGDTATFGQRGGAARGPIRITTPDADDVAVIMPLRGDDTAVTIPPRGNEGTPA